MWKWPVPIIRRHRPARRTQRLDPVHRRSAKGYCRTARTNADNGEDQRRPATVTRHTSRSALALVIVHRRADQLAGAHAVIAHDDAVAGCGR